MKGVPKGGQVKVTSPLRSGLPRILVEFKTVVTCLAWSADGPRIAAGTPDGTVHVSEVATGKVRSFPTYKNDAVPARPRAIRRSFGTYGPGPARQARPTKTHRDGMMPTSSLRP